MQVDKREKKEKRTYHLPVWIAVIVSLLVFTVCITGCNNRSWQTSPVPSSSNSAIPPTSKNTSPDEPIQPSGSNSRTTRPKTIPKTTVTVVPKTISDMLKVVPLVPAIHNDVWFVDFAALRKLHDINLENYRDTYGNIIFGGENKYITDVFLHPEGESGGSIHGLAPFISGIGMFFPYILQSPVREENIGYGPIDVEQSIVVDVWPPDEYGLIEYEAINGSFDIKAISETT